MKSLSAQISQLADGSRPLGSHEFAGSRYRYRPGTSQAVTSSADTTSRLTRLEGVLFLAREALSLRRIAQLANLADATEARTLLAQLAQQYVRRGRAFRIENVAGGFRLLTQAQFAPWIGKIAEFCEASAAELKLSPPALDTLTVVAYRQPVLRSEVEAIRGVACGELLRQLIERDLLRIVGRSEELGRPLQYGTTKRFLQVFGLKSLKDLPQVEQPPTQVASEANPQQNVQLRAA